MTKSGIFTSSRLWDEQGAEFGGRIKAEIP
jgi:hypothetical protein